MFVQSKREYTYLKFILRLSCFDWSLQPRTPVLPPPLHPNSQGYGELDFPKGQYYRVFYNCHYKPALGEAARAAGGFLGYEVLGNNWMPVREVQLTALITQFQESSISPQK